MTRASGDTWRTLQACGVSGRCRTRDRQQIRGFLGVPSGGTVAEQLRAFFTAE